MKKQELRNIARVAENNLCTGCGTCVSLCPARAIDLPLDEEKGIYIPRVDEEKCTNCEICLNVCPGHEVDFERLNLEIFGKKPEDALIGNYLNCYTGYSMDQDIRYNSSSGGLITQLLIFALENKIIDGALVTRLKKDKPMAPESFIAHTRKEIIEASKSKYCPVPANIALREILDSRKDEKFAVVGLPCHLHGIRKAELINKLLKEKLVLHLGLFCNHTPNFRATESFLRKLKIDEVIKLDYRGEGWPGEMKITTKNGEIRVLPSRYWKFIGAPRFYPKRCLMCPDALAELADISFGDAWLEEFQMKDKIGTSIVVCRNDIGKCLLDKSLAHSKLDLLLIEPKEVVYSQQNLIDFKKKLIQNRFEAFKKTRRTIPTYIG